MGLLHEDLLGVGHDTTHCNEPAHIRAQSHRQQYINTLAVHTWAESQAFCEVVRCAGIMRSHSEDGLDQCVSEAARVSSSLADAAARASASFFSAAW